MSESKWKILTVTAVSGISNFVIGLGAMFTLGDASNGFNLSHLGIVPPIIIMGVVGICGFTFLLCIMRKETGNKLTVMSFVKTILSLVAIGIFLSLIHYLRG
ncbi:hypothetical protein LG329_04485 [Virgibacillus necropolis]|uniref:hypothetical protein n=1 Tax=Virgibacillus necropolis TaxID=163877 RepID=UPI00385011DC